MWNLRFLYKAVVFCILALGTIAAWAQPLVVYGLNTTGGIDRYLAATGIRTATFGSGFSSTGSLEILNSSLYALNDAGGVNRYGLGGTLELTFGSGLNPSGSITIDHNALFALTDTGSVNVYNALTGSF